MPLPTDPSEPARSLFRRKVPLDLAHQLEPDEELAHRGTAQEGRVEVEVGVGDGGFGVERRERGLVQAHRVGEGASAECTVVSRDQQGVSMGSGMGYSGRGS